MKRFLYWLGALALVLVLLVGIGGLGFVVTERELPFSRVWGVAMALVGSIIGVAGVLFPAKLWGAPKGSTVPQRSLRKARHMAMVLGALLAAGGIGFALTSQVWILVGSFVAAVIYLRLLAPLSGVRDPDEPAA